MKKIINLLTSLVICLSTCLFVYTPVTANENDPLLIYKERLEELNEAYGTNFAIPDKTANECDYSELVSIYSSMSINQFDAYIMSLTDNSLFFF